MMLDRESLAPNSRSARRSASSTTTVRVYETFHATGTDVSPLDINTRIPRGEVKEIFELIKARGAEAMF